jgi:hypothetical protein
VAGNSLGASVYNPPSNPVAQFPEAFAAAPAHPSGGRLAKDHALTLVDHALRHGDSLVGLSRRQLEAFHWKADAARFHFLPLPLDRRPVDLQAARKSLDGGEKPLLEANDKKTAAACARLDVEARRSSRALRYSSSSRERTNSGASSGSLPIAMRTMLRFGKPDRGRARHNVALAAPSQATGQQRPEPSRCARPLGRLIPARHRASGSAVS